MNGRLVTLSKITQHSKDNWGSLAHYIGTMGVLVNILPHDETDPNHVDVNYEVIFDPSPSLPTGEFKLNRRWFVSEEEISYIALVPGTYALFRVNPLDIPQLVVITEFDDVTEEKPYRTYGFIVMEDRSEFHQMPEEFLRPFPYSRF